MKYNQLTQRLFQLNMHKGVRLGLENATQLNEILGNPDSQYKTIHVAGTNGKGSVVTKIAKALQLAGFRVGLYTSPHLHCFRERISINGDLISEHNMTLLLEKLFETAETYSIPSTFFDLTTCLAFLYFAEQKIDFAVIETGLGGKLDATNIVTPLLSVITSISLDHTEILGNTIVEIAQDKAGIIKPRVPIIIGPNVPKEVIQPIARQNEAPLYQALGNYENYDQENSAIAQEALNLLQKQHHIPSQAITDGIKAKPSCRFQEFTKASLPSWKDLPFPKTVILDVAHNPDGLKHLFSAVIKKYPNQPLNVLFGLSKTKDLVGCLQIIKNHAEHMYIVEATNGRGAPLQAIQTILSDNLDTDSSHYSLQSENLEKTISHAILKTGQQNRILVICGTFFIMNAAFKSLNIDVCSDPIDMNERLQLLIKLR